MVEKGKSTVTRKQRSEICERRLISLCGSRKCKRGKEGKANLQEKKAVLMRTGKRRLMKKLKVRSSFDEQRKRLQKQLREIDKFTDMDPMFQEGQKEEWKEDLQEVEQKRNDLLQKHQKMQCLQDKQKKCHKDACACDEDMGKVKRDTLPGAGAEVEEFSNGSR